MIRFLIGILFLSLNCFAQEDSLLTEKVTPIMKSRIDSVSLPQDLSVVSYDTTRGKRFEKALVNTSSTFLKIVGIDSFSKQERPRVVLFRSLIIPGTGQIMNKDYWKLPLVYGSAAAGFFVLKQNNSKYHEYINIVSVMKRDGISSQPYIEGGASISIETYARAASSYRRYRDLTWIGVGLGWMLFAVEANVAAHLKNFDVSDDISLKWRPTVIPSGGPLVAGVKFNLTFK